ncbi:hypothetical protein GXB81_02635 [Paraburkholderia sp. Ac-20336]|uniref:hypothetical protein n=1 Tax=Paraburkholderia sp. Ac-20336 TaxID=2703886 RepID=UPI00197DA05B|nr:hypothetical protein [Paraburkholderia sp. Ac-20336]MBN3801955.1 hypothetical protein [Paraburkholderia sp. Ac-20336]
MSTPAPVDVPKSILNTLNHLYEIERKLALHGDPANIQRNVERIKDSYADQNLFYEDPMGQPFSETRTDLEASISGDAAENLVVTEVVKPVIRFGTREYSRVVQKGIVVVTAQRQGESQ